MVTFPSLTITLIPSTTYKKSDVFDVNTHNASMTGFVDDGDDDVYAANDNMMHVSYSNTRRTRFHNPVQSIETLHVPPLDSFGIEQNQNYRCDCHTYLANNCILTLINKDDYLGFSFNDEHQKALNMANEEDRLSNNQMRYKLYRKAWIAMVSICPDIYYVVDDDGKYCRERLPQCVEYTIRSIWPEQDGFYTGFKLNS
jgi:hypothetical protein